MILVPWVLFIALILFLLALDLGVLNRRAHVIETREALMWTALWVSLSLAFTVPIYFLYERQLFGIGTHVGHPLSGLDAAVQYLTGYLVEESLSLDNIFVMALIFAYFRVPPQHQHGVLFWGILGALVMRGIMIAAGTVLLNRLEWTTYIFGGLLLYTAVKMMLAREDEMEPEQNWTLRMLRRVLPVSTEYAGGRYLVRVDGRLMATPLLAVLLVIEATDLVFAVDSIPAVLAITRDPFLVFTSNIFAVLGLRSLYFALAGLLRKFAYLRASLTFLLAFIAVKMLLHHHFHIPPAVSLAFIGGILAVGILASLAAARRGIPPFESLRTEEDRGLKADERQE